MLQQEYVRKYMIKDIVKRNLRFWWIIAVCIIAFAGLMGYMKNEDYRKRFEQIELKGTVSQLNIEYYTGNVAGEILSVRLLNAVSVIKSSETLDELNRLWGKSIAYEDFEGIVTELDDGTKDVISMRVEYPWGSDTITLLDDEDAKEFVEYYLQAVENIGNRIIGEGRLKLLGVSDVSTHEYKVTDEQRETARKAVIKNTFIGGVIGFIIPVVVITLLYLFGGRLHTAQEIAYYAGTRLLAAIPVGRDGADYGALSQASAYVGYKYGKEGIRINLLCLGDVEESVCQHFRDAFGDNLSGDVDVERLDMSDGVLSTCDGIHGNVNIIVARAGSVTAGLIEKSTYALELMDAKADGVIVYESV
jgi:hypothetical protein